MLNNRKLAISLLVTAGVLGLVAALRGAAMRAGAGGESADRQIGDLPGLDEHVRGRLADAAARKQLLAALESRVDGPALAAMLESQDWWRDIRSEFQMTRVVVGTEALATQGTPPFGAHDKDVVIEARRSGVSSATVSPDDQHHYLLVAIRLPIMSRKQPVLVLAKDMNQAAATAGAGGARTPLDFVLWGAVALFGAGGAGAMFMKRGNGSQTGLAVPGASGPESTLKFGTAVRKQVGSELSAASGVVDASSSVSMRTRVPRPPDLSAAIAPVAHSRHPTTPDGMPIAADGTAGQRFGRYTLLNRLGEGGMSEVFTAVAHGVEGFSRVFVLKRLRPELCRDKEAVAQFIDEARMQASLVHSNIVPVFDFGRVGDEYFMTQEYIVGRDVVRMMAANYEYCQETLNPRLSYYIALETLQALQFAHTRCDREGQPLGIVHRDVSAGNIIVSAQGEVKLADFGIVKSNRRVTKTQVGMVKGNANFMSPEQARGQHVDARSDLFSVGLVLYYCLTNRLLYDGDNDLDVLFKAASGPGPEFHAQIDELPSPAREVLGRALATDPAERFQTAAEFAEVLAPHVGGAKGEAVQLMHVLFGEALQREAA
jgi:Protein kinase domain